MDVLQTGIGAIRANWSFSDVNGFIYYQELGTHRVQRNRIERQTESVIEGLMPGANYSLYLLHSTTSPATVKAADLIYIGRYKHLYTVTTYILQWNPSISIPQNWL